MKVAYVGIDIASRWFDVCVLLDGKEHRSKFENCFAGFEKLIRLENLAAERIEVALEPTGRYGESLAEFLHKNNWHVREVQPFKFRQYAESLDIRTKSDLKDAYALALYCKERGAQIREWQPKTSLDFELRDMQMLIRSLTKRSITLQLQKQCGLRSTYVAQRIEEELARCKAELAEVLERAGELIARHPVLSKDVALLETIRGIGRKSAVLLVIMIDFRRFKTSRALACFLGLTQRKHESGTSIRGKECISKIGNKHIRSSLFMPALAARSSNVFMIEFAERLTQKGKHHLTVQSAVVRKLVTTAWAVVVRQTPFDPEYKNPHFAQPI